MFFILVASQCSTAELLNSHFSGTDKIVTRCVHNYGQSSGSTYRQVGDIHGRFIVSLFNFILLFEVHSGWLRLTYIALRLGMSQKVALNPSLYRGSSAKRGRAKGVFAQRHDVYPDLGSSSEILTVDLGFPAMRPHRGAQTAFILFSTFVDLRPVWAAGYSQTSIYGSL
jgi:hypothetical protein